MTIAQTQATINDMVREEVRKAYAAQDEQQQQPAADVDAEVEKGWWSSPRPLMHMAA